MQNGVGVSRVFAQQVDGLCCGLDDQFDSTALCFPFHFIHNWQLARPRADDKAPALPGYLLLNRYRRMSEGVSEFFDGFFFRLRTSP